jgi:hypothetical protein
MRVYRLLFILVTTFMLLLPVQTVQGSQDSEINWDLDSGCDGRDRLRLQLTTIDNSSQVRISFCESGGIPENLTISITAGNAIFLISDLDEEEAIFSLPNNPDNPNLLVASAMQSKELQSSDDPAGLKTLYGVDERAILPSLPVGPVIDCQRTSQLGQAASDVIGMIGLSPSGPIALSATHPCASLDLRYDNVQWLDATLISFYNQNKCQFLDLEYKLYEADGSGLAPLYNQILDSVLISSYSGAVGCSGSNIQTLNFIHTERFDLVTWINQPRNSSRGEWLSLEVTATLSHKGPASASWITTQSHSQQYLFQNGPYHLLTRNQNSSITMTPNNSTEWWGQLPTFAQSSNWETHWYQDSSRTVINVNQRSTFTGTNFFIINLPFNRTELRTAEFQFNQTSSPMWLYRGTTGWNNHSFITRWQYIPSFFDSSTPVPHLRGECISSNNTFHFETYLSVWFQTASTISGILVEFDNITSSTNQSDIEPFLTILNHNSSPQLSHIPALWNMTNAEYLTWGECRLDHGIVGENGGWVWGRAHFAPGRQTVIDSYAMRGGLEVF